MVMDVSPRTYRFLPADIFTSGYRVVGKVMITNTGLMGMLNDATHSAMEVHDAHLARLHMPTKLVDRFELSRMMKSQVFAVCMARREDLGPQALVRGGYQKLAKYNIRVTTQVYELEGTLEWSGRFDFATVMVEGTRDFVPLYNAKLTAVMIPQLSIESPAVLFNRKQVDFLAVISDKKPTGPIA